MPGFDPPSTAGSNQTLVTMPLAHSHDDVIDAREEGEIRSCSDDERLLSEAAVAAVARGSPTAERNKPKTKVGLSTILVEFVTWSRKRRINGDHATSAHTV